MLSKENEQYDRDLWTMDAMDQYGGSFVQALAQAARCADSFNLQKIKETWPEYWAEYEPKGREMQLADER